MDPPVFKSYLVYPNIIIMKEYGKFKAFQRNSLHFYMCCTEKTISFYAAFC